MHKTGNKIFDKLTELVVIGMGLINSTNSNILPQLTCAIFFIQFVYATLVTSYMSSEGLWRV